MIQFIVYLKSKLDLKAKKEFEVYKIATAIIKQNHQ